MSDHNDFYSGDDAERDYAEEAYNAHTMHTGDGEADTCDRPECPSYVPAEPTDAQKVQAIEKVTAQIVADYYASARRYHAAPGPDSPERVFFRVRLGVLQQYGDALSAALGMASPPWDYLSDQSTHTGAPARAATECEHCGDTDHASNQCAALCEFDAPVPPAA